mgnify:CR=1 FL=1
MDYSLDDVNFQIKKIVKGIRKKYNGIYGIPKNGLIVASLLSKELNVPLVGSFEELLGRKCSRCNDPFESHHHRHFTRDLGSVFHTNCYKLLKLKEE